MISDEILDLDIMLAADESQVEVRFLAEMSGDKKLISYFQSGQDIHCLVGHDLTGLPVERIKQEKGLRKGIKNMHFGIIYGKGRDGIYEYVVTKIRDVEGPTADLTGITQKGVVKQYDKYFETYDGVRVYINKQRAFVESRGYVETLFGFRSDINKTDEDRGSFWGNQAINRPIQGSAHTCVLIAMALLHLNPYTYNRLQRSIMEVHDALYWLVKFRHLREAYTQAKDLLEKAVTDYCKTYFKIDLRVPLVVEASAGFTMGSMIEYQGEPLEEFLEKWRKKQKSIEQQAWGSQRW